MIIHDHFDGSAHCVECGGPCNLTGDDLHLTQFVRYTLESFVFAHGEWLPLQIEEPLAALLGARWVAFRKHGFVATEEVKKLMTKS